MLGQPGLDDHESRHTPMADAGTHPSAGKNAGKLQDVAQNYPTPGLITRAANKLARTWQGKGAAPSQMELASGSVTTTGPATLVAVWLGDAYVAGLVVGSVCVLMCAFRQTLIEHYSW